MSEVTECVGCEYWQPLNSPGGVKACHYCIITGNVRGIPAADCYKHEGTAYKPAGKGAKEMKGKEFDTKIKAEILRKVQRGEKPKDVAGQFGIGRSTLMRWIKEERDKAQSRSKTATAQENLPAAGKSAQEPRESIVSKRTEKEWPAAGSTRTVSYRAAPIRPCNDRVYISLERRQRESLKKFISKDFLKSLMPSHSSEQTEYAADIFTVYNKLKEALNLYNK